MTTPKKTSETGSSRGDYSYMDLLNEFRLANNDARWMQKAACKGLDFHLFFPSTGKSAQVPAAKAVCRRCPVRKKCLDWANENEIHYGIWGGLTVTERRNYAKLDSNE